MRKGSIAGPRRGEYVVCSDESTGVEVDGGILVEVKSNLRDLVGAGGGTGNVGVDQLLELARVQSWLELEGSTQEGLDLELVLVVQCMYSMETIGRGERDCSRGSGNTQACIATRYSPSAGTFKCEKKSGFTWEMVKEVYGLVEAIAIAVGG